MKVKFTWLLVLLFFVVMILSACASEISPEETQPPPQSEEKEQDTAQPDNLEEPYPAPQEIIVEDGFENDPYPALEVVNDASTRDLTQAIMPNDLVVQSSDNNLQAGLVFVEMSEIILEDGDPGQVNLLLIGNLPTSCSQLRVISSEPNEAGRIEVRVYSVSDPDTMCAEVLEPFTAIANLGKFTEGTYTLSINNELQGEFELP